MDIKVTSIEPRDKLGKVAVSISISQKRESGVWDNASFDVFVEASDSLTDVRTRAIAPVRAFAVDISDSATAEATED
jgi:hypothetical protein